MLIEKKQAGNRHFQDNGNFQMSEIQNSNFTISLLVKKKVLDELNFILPL